MADLFEEVKSKVLEEIANDTLGIQGEQCHRDYEVDGQTYEADVFFRRDLDPTYSPDDPDNVCVSVYATYFDEDDNVQTDYDHELGSFNTKIESDEY